MKEGTIFTMGFLVGVGLCIVLLSGFILSDGYKNGQLDYQRGIIKYELTETGYKEIVEVNE